MRWQACQWPLGVDARPLDSCAANHFTCSSLLFLILNEDCLISFRMFSWMKVKLLISLLTIWEHKCCLCKCKIVTWVTECLHVMLLQNPLYISTCANTFLLLPLSSSMKNPFLSPQFRSASHFDTSMWSETGWFIRSLAEKRCCGAEKRCFMGWFASCKWKLKHC